MKKVFNVLLWDFNQDKLIHYDVLPYLRDCYQDTIKHKDDSYFKTPKTFEEFKHFIERNSRYQFWTRCQYEMICHGWPVQKKDHKLDVHEQIMMNIDIIAEILFEEYNTKEPSNTK